MTLIKNSFLQNIPSFLLLAAALDLLVPFVLAIGYPGYSHLHAPISALSTAQSPVQKWAQLNLSAVGALFCLSAFRQMRNFIQITKYEKRYLLGLLLFGLGSILAGIFPEDSPGVQVESTSAKIHGIASFIGFVFLSFCPIWANRIPQIKTNNSLNNILFFLIILTFLLFLLSGNSSHSYTGLWQRINLLLLYTSLVINYPMKDDLHH